MSTTTTSTSTTSHHHQPQQQQQQKHHIIKIAHNKTKVFTTRSTLRVVSSPNPTEEFSKHYKLGSVLGKGSFATVFQATHLETGDQVAVKAIGFGYASSSSSAAGTNQQQGNNNSNNDNKSNNTTPEQQQKIVMEQVEREINFFSNVPPHPNIIRAREVFTTSSLLHGALSPDSLLNPQDAAALAKAAVASPTVPLASSSSSSSSPTGGAIHHQHQASTNSATSSAASSPATPPQQNQQSSFASHQQHQHHHQQTFIVLELAVGGDLFDIIVKKQGLPEDESRCIFRQLTSAVHHMHSYGFAHSDLKPENILLMAEDDTSNSDINCRGCKCLDCDGNPVAKPHVTIKVEDFGFTRNKSDFYVASPRSVEEQQQQLEQLHQLQHQQPAPRPPLLLTRQECQGSFAFVSPEKISVARGKLYAFDAFAADVWSTGVILFMTLSACDPFTNSNPAAHGGRTTFDNIVCGGFKRSSKVWAVKGALDLITQMFTVDTSRRAMTAEQVAEHEWMQGSDNWRLEDFIVNDLNSTQNNNSTTPKSSNTNNTNNAINTTTVAPTTVMTSIGTTNNNNNVDNTNTNTNTTATTSTSTTMNSTTLELKTSPSTTTTTTTANVAVAAIAAFQESLATPTTALSPATQLMMELVTEQIQNNEIKVSVDNKNGVVSVAEPGPLIPLLPPPAPIVQVPLVAVANMIIQQQQNSKMSLQSTASTQNLLQHDSPNNTVVVAPTSTANNNDDDHHHYQDQHSESSSTCATPPPSLVVTTVANNSSSVTVPNNSNDPSQNTKTTALTAVVG